MTRPAWLSLKAARLGIFVKPPDLAAFFVATRRAFLTHVGNIIPINLSESTISPEYGLLR
jgi:hypothetical protein